MTEITKGVCGLGTAMTSKKPAALVEAEKKTVERFERPRAASALDALQTSVTAPGKAP
jgi:hypothetical protein